MSALLQREETTAEVFQEDDTLPECLRSYQPFVMLWSEKRPEQSDRKINWQFSDNYQGITDVDYSMHEVTHLTSDGNGGVLVDCTFS